MNKESLFLSSIIILVVFEVGYYLINPSTLWNLGVGTITSVVVVGLSIGLVAGLNLAASGENIFGTRLAFIASTLFCILFQFDIPVTTSGGVGLSIFSGILSAINLTHSTPTIPIGIGLLYPNLTNIFITSDGGVLGMFGLIIVSIIIFITVISGVMIAAGGGSGGD